MIGNPALGLHESNNSATNREMQGLSDPCGGPSFLRSTRKSPENKLRFCISLGSNGTKWINSPNLWMISSKSAAKHWDGKSKMARSAGLKIGLKPLLFSTFWDIYFLLNKSCKNCMTYSISAISFEALFVISWIRCMLSGSLWSRQAISEDALHCTRCCIISVTVASESMLTRTGPQNFLSLSDAWRPSCSWWSSELRRDLWISATTCLISRLRNLEDIKLP